jgi:hypothetical protein
MKWNEKHKDQRKNGFGQNGLRYTSKPFDLRNQVSVHSVSFSLLFFGFTSFDIYYLFVIESIIIRTIAMKEIFMRHNGLNLK